MGYNLSIEAKEFKSERGSRDHDKKSKSFIYNCISAPSVLCISLLHAGWICGYRGSKIPVFYLYFLGSADYTDGSCCSGRRKKGKLPVKETGGVSNQMG